MAFNLSAAPGLVDLPDGLLASGKVAADFPLIRINENAKFGAVMPEVFYGEYKSGDTVPLPVSTVDGYNYQRSELIYVWEQRSTLNYATHMAGAAGELILCAPWVNPTDGVVQVLTAYYIQGAAQGNTNDGIIGVWTLGVRGRGVMSLAASLAFTDLADSAFNQDAALKTGNLVNLNRNAKLSAVRCEIFSKSATLDAKGFPAGYVHGETVPLPTSPVDGYAYARGELSYLPFWIYTGKPNRSGSTGPGRIRFLSASVNVSTGLISLQVNYWDNKTETVTTDGIVGVLVVAQRSLGSMAAPGGNAFSDLDEALFFAGAICGDTTFKALNKNAKFAMLRPEAFIGSYTHGQTIPLPTSPVDGYTYSRAELIYLYTLAASTVTGALGAIQLMIHGVAPLTGVVSCRLDYNNNGQNRQQTTEGQLCVLTLAFRAHETTIAAVEPTPPGPPPAPDPPTWVEFSGEDGSFYFELSTPDDQRELVFHQVQLASDAGFTTLLRFVDLGRALQKTLRFAGVTRYARARSRFIAGDWSTWINWGAPGAVFSGYPVDRYAPGGVFDPADRRLGNDVRQHDASGNPRHLFRYDDPAHTADLIVETATRSHVHPDAIDANRYVDLAKSGVVGKAVEMVRNPNFESGDRDWGKGTGWSIVADGNAYNGAYAAKYLGTTQGVLYNPIKIPVQPGDVILATCMAKRTVGVGDVRIAIGWYTSADAYISPSYGNLITSSSYTTTRVVGTAPATAHDARVWAIVGASAGTTAYFDQFNASLTPKDLDDVAPSATRSPIHPSYVDGSYRPTTIRRASDDLPAGDIFRYQGAGAHSLDNVPEGATYGRVLGARISLGVPYVYRGEWVASTSYLKGDEVAYPSAAAGNIYACTIANSDAIWTVANWLLIGPATVDQVSDGTTYARTTPNQRDGGGRGYNAIDAGNVVVAGGIDFTRAYTNKHIDNVPDGTTRKAVTAIDAAGKALIDFSQAAHTNKNLDNVADGTRVAWSSGTQKAAAVDASGNILLKNVAVVNGATSGPVLTGNGTYQTVTELSITKTTKGNQVYLSFAAGFSATDTFAAYLVYFALFCDTTRVSPEYCIQASDSIQYTALGVYIDTPTAAAHTFTVKCKTASGVLVTLVGTQRSFSMIELG